MIEFKEYRPAVNDWAVQITKENLAEILDWLSKCELRESAGNLLASIEKTPSLQLIGSWLVCEPYQRVKHLSSLQFDRRYTPQEASNDY